MRLAWVLAAMGAVWVQPAVAATVLDFGDLGSIEGCCGAPQTFGDGETIHANVNYIAEGVGKILDLEALGDGGHGAVKIDLPDFVHVVTAEVEADSETVACFGPKCVTGFSGILKLIAPGNSIGRLTFTAGPADINLSYGFATFKNITLYAVPEPATWALMILGIGAVGLRLRRLHIGQPAL